MPTTREYIPINQIESSSTSTSNKNNLTINKSLDRISKFDDEARISDICVQCEIGDDTWLTNRRHFGRVQMISLILNLFLIITSISSLIWLIVYKNIVKIWYDLFQFNLVFTNKQFNDEIIISFLLPFVYILFEIFSILFLITRLVQTIKV
jgi:hypothetical protein